MNTRKLGAVYTPIEVANSLTRLTLSKCQGKCLSILEPSVGDGFFLTAIKNSSKIKHKIQAIDINALVIDDLRKNFDNYSSKASSFLEKDFIQYTLDSEGHRFDLIIGNPPFIRKHNFSTKFKEHLEALSKQSNYPLKDLKNSWAAFVVASETLLSPSGVLSFIVPYEIMTVDYGQKIQKFLSSKFEKVDVYIPDEKAFKTIDQDAVAFIAQKKTSEDAGMFIHRVQCLSDLNVKASQRVDHNTSRNISLDLKGFLFNSETIELLHKLRSKCKQVSDYCESAPGIVTAANDFFIRTKEDIEELGLTDWAKPILKKSAFLPCGPLFSAEDFKNLEKNNPCYFIHLEGKNDDQFPPSVLRYIEYGVSLDLPNRYKCRKRKYWYEVPITPKTSGFFFKRSHRLPRLCINEANVLVTDTAYRISLHKGVSMEGLCYSFYNSLTLLFSEIDGRFYGGGVLELTPSEFKGLPLVYCEPTTSEFQDFVSHHYHAGDTAECLAHFGDKWLQNKLDLSDRELTILHNAWKNVRDHRLRHGTKS